MLRNLHGHIQQIVQRLRNMAGHKSANLDAEVSKIFVESDKARGVDAFEAAALQIPQTARPGSDSPLKKTFALEEGKGSASTRFVPTPRLEHKADSEAQPQQVPKGESVCCRCDVTNTLAGPACWNCKSHYVCRNCYSA